MHLEFTAMLCCIRQLVESPWLQSHWEPQVQGSTSCWKVMSHPMYTAGSHARRLWTDVVQVRLRLSFQQQPYTANLYLLHIHNLREATGISLNIFNISGLDSRSDSYICWNTNLFFQRSYVLNKCLVAQLKIIHFGFTENA